MKTRNDNRRGVALILVLTTIAILTAVGVDFSYGSRVNLRLAENARDELRAYYLARSAVNLSRLLLHFQKQVDQTGGMIGGALQNLLPPQQGQQQTPPQQGQQTPQQRQAAPQSNNLGIRLWEILPVNSNAMGALLGGGDLAALGVDKAADGDKPRSDAPRRFDGGPLHAFGAFEGSFTARIVDENSRINVRGLDGLQTSGTPAATLIQLRAMMSDPKYDFIFDEEDANHDRVRREDIILAMKDWIDVDENGSALDPTNVRSPFVSGFSDENSAYDRYVPRYKAKNAPMDSLDELYMVRGVSDRFMAAFGDRLTVWPDVNAKLNINTNDPLQMTTNIVIAARNPNDPRLRDPRLIQTILQEIQLRKMFAFFGLSAQDFVQILTRNGIQVNPDLANPTSPNNFFTSTSDTFRIAATGRVGRVDRTVVAVVRYDDQLGKLLYWKEE
jgi:general secretion pathway protein K